MRVGRRGRLIHHLILIALLWILLAQLALGSRCLSLTSDEPSHIAAGITYLATGELWALPLHGHPPLINALAAWPLLLQPQQPDWRALPGWADDFSAYVRAVWPLLGPVERLAFVTRLPIMLMALLLAALVFRWAAELFGRTAGVLAVALVAFDPNMIAHAQLNTTDVGMALTGFAALYAAWRATLSQSEREQWAATLLSGVLLGLTMAGKASGFLYAPAIIAVFAWGYASSKRSLRCVAALRKGVGQVLTTGVAALGVLWCVYLGEVGPLPGGAVVPFPSHFGVWQTVFRDVARSAFLRGEIRTGGWWWYFPYSTAVKTPIPLLFGALLTAAVWLRSGRREWQRTLPLLVFPALYWATAIHSKMNIGHRHLLPTFPFVYVLVGQLAATAAGSPRQATRLIRQCLLLALLGWYAVEALAAYPFYLTYFNQFAGGARNGHRHLVDSNLDWGQSFKALKGYMDEEGIDQVWLSYYTYVDPAAYGISYRPIAPAPGAPSILPARFDPAPGVYAIGATTLQGIMVVDPDTYDWFRHRDPVARPGVAMFVYRVEQRERSPTWLAQCMQPVAPLTSEAAAQGFGRSELRLAYFDCTSAWLYPTGGQTPGWYALFRDTAHSDDRFVRSRLSTGRLSFEQRQGRALPPFSIYEQPIGRVARPSFTSDPPVRVGNLTFLGYTIAAPQPPRPGQTVEIETWWQVESTPRRPLSIMLHLIAPGGAFTVVGDGLGVPIESWLSGDIFVQRHVLNLPADAPPGAYTLATGAYWLDTMERWPVEEAGCPPAGQLMLPAVTVSAGR